MKQIKTEDAAGQVLCHDITRIIAGKTKEVAFKKGHIVTEGDIPALLSLGKEHLYVWEYTAGMLHENEAAEILYGLCAGPHMRPGPVREGKIELIAEADGLFTADARRLYAVNALGGMMIAARHTNSPVKKGDVLAGTRVIPLVIEAERMEAARAAAGPAPLFALHPYRRLRYAMAVTGGEVAKGRIRDDFSPVLRRKMAEYGCEEAGCAVLGDEPEAITRAVLDFIRGGAQLVLCTGGMSVDPDDRTPLAIKNTGARVVSYGAPVLPGAMFMLAYLKSPPAVVMGLPGCVMYAKRTVFDLILPRVLAGLPVSRRELAALGHGGLCLGCPVCNFPNCGFGR